MDLGNFISLVCIVCIWIIVGLGLLMLVSLASGGARCRGGILSDKDDKNA